MAACARSVAVGYNSPAASTSLSPCKQRVSSGRSRLTCHLLPQVSRKCLSLSSSTLAGNTQAFMPKTLPLAQNFSGLRITCGGFIPAEHRWMYEGLQKLGPDVWETTYYPKADDHLNINKTWYVVDASKKKLGRLASAIAYHIRGKNVPEYTPSLDMGAYVIVVNAENIEVSGKKRSQKLYRRHSGRPGGMKVETFEQLQKRIPERIIEHAVKGMLPKGRLGRRLFTHLKVYKGSEHPHVAQQPVPLPIKDKHCIVVE